MSNVKNLNDDQDESNQSVAWYALLWNYCTIATMELKNILIQIPDFLFPDGKNPGEKNILSWIGISGWPAEILKAIGPIALFFQWKNTFQSFVKLGAAENKNFIRYKEAFINLLTSVSWTFISVLTVVGATALLLKTAPFILTTLFGLGAINGLINCGLNLYYAFTAKDPNVRHDYLIKAAKNLLSIITNTFAFVVSFYLNIKVLDAAASLNDDFFNAITTIGDAFVTSANVLTALTVSTVLSVTMATHQLNQETWEAITHPRETWNAIKTTITHNPLSIIPMIFNLAIRSVALVFAPLQILSNKISNKFKKNTDETPVSLPDSKQVESQTVNKINLLNKQLGKDKDISLQSSTFKMLPEISRRRLAKKELLVRLQTGAEPSETIISEVKKIEPTVFYSFWSRKGEVQQLAESWAAARKTV